VTLTSQTTNALRVLRFAVLRAQAPVRADDLSAVHRPARPHVMRVVHGFRLGRAPAGVVHGGVVRPAADASESVASFLPEATFCPLIGVRGLAAPLRQAGAAFTAVLDRLTLTDSSTRSAGLMNRIPPVQEA
jgi:DNA-binding IscR family transcriptional regulator